MNQFLPFNGNQNIPTEKIDSYISYMSQVYNVQQFMLIQAQNQIMQAQLLKLQSVSQNQSALLQQKIIKLLEQILQRGTQISIKDFLPQSQIPILAKFIGNIIIYLLKQCSPDSDELTSNYMKDPNTILIDQKSWDLICEIISNKLVYLGANEIFCTNDSQIGIISQSLLFSGIIRKVIFKKLHTNADGGNQQQIILGTLNDLLGEESRQEEFLYKFLCEEDKSILSKQSCSISLEKMFQKSSQYFHQSNLIESIIENQKQFTTNGNFEHHAEKYLNIIKVYKNTYPKLIIEQLLNVLFVNSQQIDCKEFTFQANRLDGKLKSVLYMFVDLVRIENSIIQIVLENKISEEPQKNPLEYYAKLIEKIKNKCRSKEDEFCNCKRCQCIKRNRDSAREAQKRKREALEKIGPLQQEYEKITKKVKLLEFDNTKLKTVLFEALKNPIVESLLKTQYNQIFSSLNIEGNLNQQKEESSESQF